MAYEKAYIPYGAYWSSPFVKWQGSFANLHAIELAAQTGALFFENRGISPKEFQGIIFGQTIPAPMSFYGGPWLAALLGNEGITGPTINQACVTGLVCARLAAQDVEMGGADAVLVVTADRCSNGPHLYYPSQTSPGATGQSEDWVWDNFSHDPWAKGSMIQTAENVAREHGIDRESQDELAVRRYEQYCVALSDDGAFQRRYMIPVPVGRGKKARLVTTDEGVFPTTQEGLKKLRPVLPEGTVSFGTQTHPADGNAGLIVTTRERAAEMSTDPKVLIQFRGFATARTKKGFMAAAVPPAAAGALKDAGIRASELAAVKTHNPFAVNDLLLARELGIPWEDMNNYGSSLIWGHPQGPTALRSMMELIEELHIKGGGRGLFAGCAAGDTAAACVIEVSS